MGRVGAVFILGARVIEFELALQNLRAQHGKKIRGCHVGQDIVARHGLQVVQAWLGVRLNK